MQTQSLEARNNSAGFSLIELVIAMTITLAIMAAASTMLAQSFNIRQREDDRTDSIADVQRAINIMSREISVGGYGFDSASNGIVANDSDGSTLRIRANLNRFTNEANKYTIADAGEDLKYQVIQSGGRSFLVRYDRYAAANNQKTVLANRIDSLQITYLDANNAVINVAANPALVVNAMTVRLTVSVGLDASGTPGSPGYQPATTVQLVSDVTLRNKTETLKTY